jgi:hypothetical protein
MGETYELCQTLTVNHRAAVRYLLFAASVLILFGCSDGRGGDDPHARLRAAMKLLGLEYGGYLAQNNGSPPSDEVAFRNYLQSRLTSLNDFGVKSPDDLLPAGRDGRPLTLIFAAKMPVSERGDVVWSAHEATAVDGFRVACDSRGGIHELSDETFASTFPANPN